MKTKFQRLTVKTGVVPNEKNITFWDNYKRIQNNDNPIMLPESDIPKGIDKRGKHYPMGELVLADRDMSLVIALVEDTDKWTGWMASYDQKQLLHAQEFSFLGVMGERLRVAEAVMCPSEVEEMRPYVITVYNYPDAPNYRVELTFSGRFEAKEFKGMP
ncbi:MAG: hypothetical protein AAF570_08030 [Bacteroidota bacterium]